MYIYNSLTNQKEKFIPIEENKVKMYVCGPTVYNYIHVGNARPVIFFDVVRRYLSFIGYEVLYVSNITDVDDKIIKTAIEENVNEKEIAERFTEAFLSDINQLQCVPYDVTPKVTLYMDKIIAFIEELVQKGYAYESDGDVYFKINKIEDYGKLSNQEIEHLEVGARITEHSKKESPLDFTLWKKTNQGVKWESPWGMGRPGWHTECVAMIHDTLGDKIDIHGGGTDLKFPHHENEIAQSQAIAKTSLANYWMHNGRLMVDDEKMSKSLGNFIRLKDFLVNNDQQILRYLMLSTHYRQPLNYTDEIIEGIKKEVNKHKTTLTSLQYKIELNNGSKIDIDSTFYHNLSKEYVEDFKEAMDDDFNTPNALTVLLKLNKEVNKKIRKKMFDSLELKELKGYYKLYKNLLGVLGLDYEITALSDEVKMLIKKRDEARQKKDFEKADAYRKELQEKGINI